MSIDNKVCDRNNTSVQLSVNDPTGDVTYVAGCQDYNIRNSKCRAHREWQTHAGKSLTFTVKGTPISVRYGPAWAVLTKIYHWFRNENICQYRLPAIERQKAAERALREAQRKQ